MSDKFEIILKYIKDISSETPDSETFLLTRDNLSKYILEIHINSKPVRKNLVDVETTLELKDKSESFKKSHFEMTFGSVVKIDESIKNKNDLEKILLVEVQKKIFPEIKEKFLKLLDLSNYPEIQINKEIDFEELYKNKSK